MQPAVEVLIMVSNQKIHLVYNQKVILVYVIDLVYNQKAAKDMDEKIWMKCFDISLRQHWHSLYFGKSCRV